MPLFSYTLICVSSVFFHNSKCSAKHLIICNANLSNVHTNLKFHSALPLATATDRSPTTPHSPSTVRICANEPDRIYVSVVVCSCFGAVSVTSVRIRISSLQIQTHKAFALKAKTFPADLCQRLLPQTMPKKKKQLITLLDKIECQSGNIIVKGLFPHLK